MRWLLDLFVCFNVEIVVAFPGVLKAGVVVELLVFLNVQVVVRFVGVFQS